MSIKKLFESADSTRKYLSETDSKDAFSDAESARNVSAVALKHQTYEAQLDFTTASNFAKYGSAELYYKSALDRIVDYYPYDGSEAELNEYYNRSLDVDKYVFNQLYPRTHGLAVFSPPSTSSADGWGTSTVVVSGTKDIEGMWYGKPSDLEYIHFYGGPGTASMGINSSLATLSPNDYNDQFKYSNIYDEDIYTTAGLPSTWGSGSRESNLMADFGRGVTIEFWMKTGSYDDPAAFADEKTGRQVIFDMWNGYASSSAHYGRVTLELTGGAPGGTGGIWLKSPFRLTVQSGASGIFNKRIGYSNSTDRRIATSSIGAWSQWAFAMQITASAATLGGEALRVELYRDGYLHDAHNFGTTAYGTFIGNEINSKNMRARIGSLITAPSGTAEIASWAGTEILPAAFAGAGKLSASLDEFRYWKVRRTPKEIGEHWFTQVRGGVNSDISNTALGMYYKFNEGITHTASVDSIVLDYGGRVANGLWTGYKPTMSRTTGSAILQATASISEYKDPIIRSNHPDVVSLRNSLIATGSDHDSRNNSMLVNYVPAWVIEEHEYLGNDNLKVLCHIMGTYFDTLHRQISEVPKLRQLNYTSASYKPIPFAKNLPQSLGMYMPELFIDSTVQETFMNRDADSKFKNNLNDTKNLIYLNLYNNLTNIFKSKGNEKAVRNVFRCFNIDERLIKLNTYVKNTTYVLRNNLQQTRVNKTYLNFNNVEALGGVVYNALSSSNPNSRGYITGSKDASPPPPEVAHSYEDRYGFTVDTDITFPPYLPATNTFSRDYRKVSLFGMDSVNTASANCRAGTVTQWPSYNPANFQVYAIKSPRNPRNVSFMITSSVVDAGSDSPALLGPIPLLTTSYFRNTYDEQQWNISVRLRPATFTGPDATFPLADTVTGSSTYSYQLVFRGVKNNDIDMALGGIQDSFELTASVPQSYGQGFLRAPKRLYVGARRTNITGALLQPCDILFGGIRYYAKFIDDLSLDQHAYDVNNSGISASYQNISPFDPNIVTSSHIHEMLNSDMLALDWNFNNATASNDSTSDAQFHIEDFSSGSAQERASMGWVGEYYGWQHTAYGRLFPTSSTKIGIQKAVNSFKFIDPEQAISSDMIRVLTEDDRLYGIEQIVPNYYYTIEKSMYSAISEEMLDFFAGVIDFHNIIGEPVNRYRDRYKAMEKLRERFFRRVTKTSTVEKYIDYYKWFDDAISQVISQIVPASADFEPEIFNTIESHVLERNKYQTKYPTLEFHAPELDGAIMGGTPWLGSYAIFSTPLPSSPRSQKVRGPFWKFRALRTSTELSAINEHPSDAALANTINEQKERIRKAAFSNHLSQSRPFSFTSGGVSYRADTYAIKNYGKLYNFTISNPVGTGSYFKGGVNFNCNKNFEYTYDSLRPAGPINLSNGGFVPLNVLFAETSDLVKLQDLEMLDANPAGRKIKRTIKVQQGKQWEDGTGYKNTKSSFAFPFNIFSSSVVSGYNKSVVDRVTASIEITNLHNDVYGPDLEKPLQGPFTEHNVGGHQSRHIAINEGSDTWNTRPEAWKLLLGKCPNTSGAIGMAGPDYPWPDANDTGAPYPMTSSQKAVYYRGFIAKRPVNIRNILIATASQLAGGKRTGHNLGNYNANYEIVQTVGAFETARRNHQEQTTLPTVIQDFNPNRSNYTDVVSNFLNLRNASGSHFNYHLNYMPVGLSGSNNKSIILSRFAAPGGPEVMSRGFQDVRSSEYSVYNSINYRNLAVKNPSQGPSGSFTNALGTGSAGSRVFDIHGKAFGLSAQLSRHTARFGRDSLFVTSAGNLPGASYDQFPGFHKVHRNTLQIMKSGSVSSSVYDNFFVQHPIPRSDRQYSWITSSIYNPDSIRHAGRSPYLNFLKGYFSSSTGFDPFFDFITGSVVVASSNPTFYQPVLRINTLIQEPITDTQIGHNTTEAGSTYINTVLVDKLGLSAEFDNNTDYLNLLLTQRGGTFGWGWKSLYQNDNPIIVKQRVSSSLVVADMRDNTRKYRLAPVSMRGRTAYVNFTTPGTNNASTAQNITLQCTHNNNKIYFNETDLNNRFNIDLENVVTVYDQIIDTIHIAGYSLHWVLYRQNLFPSLRNEFASASTSRIGYDNKFWRDDRISRNTVGNSFNNSFNIDAAQSCWSLDPQTDFITRTAPPDLAGGVNNLRNNGSAGELQNNYTFYFKGAANPEISVNGLSPGALYSRKQMLTTVNSVVARTGVKIAETGSKEQAAVVNFGDSIDNYCGEATWEAGPTAGIVLISGSTNKFEPHATNPWWKNYNDYKYELKLIAKDFAIVPEFRISEHVEDYVKYGLDNKDKLDIFEIPGTTTTSVTSSFYLDYSNSEFMKDFLKVKADTLLDAKEIRLIVSAACRFNPYKGFYPADRTLDLITQLSRSFAHNFIATSTSASAAGETVYNLENMLNLEGGGNFRPVAQALYAPGILYNSIKSGMAVDYPIVSQPARIVARSPGLTTDGPGGAASDNYYIATNYDRSGNNVEGYTGEGAEFWDFRVPFEAIMAPEKYINHLPIVDAEPHPSCSLNATGTLGPPSDSVYTMMAENFFGEVGNFYLENNTFSKLQSGIVRAGIQFETGSVYGARLKMFRSTTGKRTYQNDSGSTGDRGGCFTTLGAIAYSGSAEGGNLTELDGYFSIPQDPTNSNTYKELFTLYSRPTAFGPPAAGRVLASNTNQIFSGALSGAVDCFNGYNWAFTPPYYYGECWVDFVFRPSASVSYDLDRILAELVPVYRRVDPGPVIEFKTGFYSPSLILDSKTYKGVYEGKNINVNSMQLSASLNLFKTEPVYFKQRDRYGNIQNERNEIIGKSWVIQPKFETPHLNFNDEGTHPITNATNNLTLPTTFGRSAVPRGMWHQFGVMESEKGIYLQIDDIPTNWLQYHYDVIGPSGSVYNNYIDAPNDINNSRTKVYEKMQSLTSLLNFDSTKRSVKLGNVAESKTIREAIVAVPYIIESVNIEDSQKNKYGGEYRSTRKKFITLPAERFEASLNNIEGSALGDSLSAAGSSIRKLVQKMQRYVFPPQLDFINNRRLDPVVMYIFEFEHTFDKDDLAYMWQNTAPRDYAKIELKYQSVAHELLDLELLNENIIMDNPNLRWMVFKVKEKSQINYFDLMSDQEDSSNTGGAQVQFGDAQSGYIYNQSTELLQNKANNYKVSFNWPYDYVSFVEMVKFDAEILYKQDTDLQTIDGDSLSTTTLSKQQQRSPGRSRQVETEAEGTTIPSSPINVGSDY